MNIIQALTSIIAPHQCVGCGTEGGLLCEWCFYENEPETSERCIECNALSVDARTCSACKQRRGLPRNVWFVSAYEGVVKELLLKLKYSNASVAANELAEYMDSALPYFSPDTVVAHIPTSSKRVRVRGYDQSQLIARRLAERRGLNCASLLDRTTHSKQVGASRSDRVRQLDGAFEVPPKADVSKSAQVLLVDDIYTTGGTLGAATATLRRAGYKNIYGAVCARAM